MRATWSSVTCPKLSPTNQNKGKLRCHPGRNCTRRALGKGFHLPKLIKSEKWPNSNSIRMASFRGFNGVYYITFHKNKPVVFPSACFKRGMCNALRNEAGAGMVLWTGLFNDKELVPRRFPRRDQHDSAFPSSWAQPCFLLSPNLQFPVHIATHPVPVKQSSAATVFIETRILQKFLNLHSQLLPLSLNSPPQFLFLWLKQWANFSQFHRIIKTQAEKRNKTKREDNLEKYLHWNTF